MSAISHCETMGYEETDIIIDSIISGPKELANFDMNKGNSFSIMLHTSKMSKYYEHVHGVLRAQQSHANVLFRYVVGPSFDMPNKILPTQFNSLKVKDLLIGG